MSQGGRGPILLATLVPGFVVGVTFGLGKIIRDCSLTCNVGYRYAPLAVLAVAIATLPAAALRARYEARLGFTRWQVGTVVFVAGSFVAFRAATAAALSSGPEASRWTYLAFFVWLGVVGAVVGPNVKSTVYRLSPPAARPRMLAMSAASVMAGGLLGSAATSWVVPWFMEVYTLRYEDARDWMMVAMGVVLSTWIPVAILGGRRGTEPPPPAAPASPSTGMLSALRRIGRNPRHRRMATLVAITGVAEALVVYLFYWVVTEQTSAAGGRTVFFAEFYTWLHAGTLALLVFGANRILDRVGLVAALASLPLALLAGTTVFLVHTVVLVMYVLRIAEAVIEESVYGLALERVLLGVDERDAPVVRPMLQGLMSRAGRGVGAILVIALELGMELSMTGFALVYMGVLLLWMVAVFRVCRQDLGSGGESDAGVSAVA